MHEMDGDKKGEKEMSPVMTVFMLVPIVPLGDLFIYYKINDFNTASTSEWTTAANFALVGPALTLVGIAATMFGNNASVMMLPAFNFVHEIAQLYFINSADGVLTSSDVNLYYGVTGFNLVVAAAKAMIMKSNKKDRKDGDRPEKDGQWDDQRDDQQKEGGPKDGDKPPKPDGGYDGYYGYY